MDSESVVAQVQRKIELQSPEDLAYLIANVRSAAAAHLNEAFPVVSGEQDGEDELRNQIEKLVNEVSCTPGGVVFLFFGVSSLSTYSSDKRQLTKRGASCKKI